MLYNSRKSSPVTNSYYSDVVLLVTRASIVVTETTAKPSDRPSSPPPHPVADEESLIAEAQESLEKSFEFLDNQDDSDSDSGKLYAIVYSKNHASIPIISYRFVCKSNTMESTFLMN